MSAPPEQEPSASQPTPEGPTPSSSSSSPPGTLPPLPLPTPPDLDAILRAATASNPALPPPHGRPVLKSPRPSMEKYDEKCWTRTKQTNARRALGREPQVTMYCYLNFRNSLSDLVPVPGTVNSFLARDVAPGSPDEVARTKAFKGKGKAVEGGDGEGEGPHWNWLDGRYIYIARGREAVARHMKEMGGVVVDGPVDEGRKGPKILRKSGEEEQVGAWGTIARIEERCERSEAQKMLPGKREEQVMRRAMGLDEDDSERLISLSSAYTSSLSRLHAHIIRIYSPGLNQLARLPSTFTDGTQAQMLDTVYTRLTDGSAFKFAGRLYDSFWTVQGQFAERRRKFMETEGKKIAEEERKYRERRGGASGYGGFGGGFGGVQPPVPPREKEKSVESGEGGAEGEGSPPKPPPGGKKGEPVVGPDGKLYPPGTKVIVCTVM
ncbi:hypothetical protein JCM6882_001891 [Rhodosporidiobolus microsporus]